jgi:hypothetical protein
MSQPYISTALGVYERYGDEKGWVRYLARHRHGGVEFGSGLLAYRVRDMRVFALRSMVGFVWAALAIQAEAIDHWALGHPFDLTVAMRGVNGALWATSPRDGPSRARSARCLHLHRRAHPLPMGTRRPGSHRVR